MEKKRFLTEKEVSEMTGIALSTLRNHRSLGVGLPYCKFGRIVRYSLDETLNFFKAHTVQTQTERKI
jgi:predicted DNA-binding transcriptional regulator AlpA